MPEETSIGGASRVYATVAAIANAVLFIGVSVSLYAYWHFPHPSIVQHPTRTPWSESIESYLFVFQVMQVVPLFVTARIALFWDSYALRTAKWDAWAKAKRPYMRDYNSVAVHNCVLIGMVAASALLLGLSAYRSLLAATGRL
jgi:hypothetical protein